MKRAKWAVVAALSLVAAAYASFFVLAELVTEVVVLRTYDSEGSPYETRVTVIDIEGRPWIRGRSYRGWFRRVGANPDAEVHRAGAWQRVRASISRDPADAAAFGEVMVENDGLTYRYLDFITRMSSNEVPVRLVPRSP